MTHLKLEGKALHPDDVEYELTDEEYKKQALAYIADTGDVYAVFVRDDLIGD